MQEPRQGGLLPTRRRIVQQRGQCSVPRDIPRGALQTMLPKSLSYLCASCRVLWACLSTQFTNRKRGRRGLENISIGRCLVDLCHAFSLGFFSLALQPLSLGDARLSGDGTTTRTRTTSPTSTCAASSWASTTPGTSATSATLGSFVSAIATLLVLAQPHQE